MTEQKVVICPYCGETQPLADRCRACAGLFEPLSRQATHNAMGPWFVRDPERPFQPGCSYETLLRLVQRGRVTKFTIVRGPTTRQFWTIAKHVPGLAHLLGYCHSCDASVDPGDHGCHACGVPFGAYLDRNFLGLPEIRPLPWEADGQEEVRPPIREPGATMWRADGDEDEPRTISSFASDDELLGRGEYEGSGAALPPSFGGEGEAQSQGEPSPTAVAEGEPEVQADHAPQPSPPAVQPVPDPTDRQLHALRRSMLRQQQRNRVLMAVAGGLALLVIVFTLGWFNAMYGGPAEQERQAPQDERAGDAQRESRDAGADDTPITRPRTIDDPLARYNRALGLIEVAADEDRPLSERIADYEEAVKLLEAVKAGAEPGAVPDDLQQQLEDARWQLERLQLREFFP